MAGLGQTQPDERSGDHGKAAGMKKAHGLESVGKLDRIVVFWKLSGLAAAAVTGAALPTARPVVVKQALAGARRALVAALLDFLDALIPGFTSSGAFAVVVVGEAVAQKQ